MNNDIIEVIKKQKHENKLSHAYLIETNDFDKYNEKLKTILKLFLCQNNIVYCDDCQDCHFINNFEHPNVVLITPDGASIKISQIVNLKRQFNMKSSYGKYNIYVILGAEKLNETSGNALLKFLEEPEEGIIGILLTNNKSLVLPTIVSRCQIFNDYFDVVNYSESVVEIAKKIDDCTKSELAFADYSNIIKNIEEKDELKYAFGYILENELINGCNSQKIAILKEIIEKMRYNVNIDLLLINYLIRMRELDE